MSKRNEKTEICEAGKPTERGETCVPGCGCHAAGPAGKTHRIVGVIVLVAAGVLVARAVMRKNGASDNKTAPVYASAPAAQTPAPAAGTVPAANQMPAASDTVAIKEIGALSELNAVATDMVGVFVFLPGKSETTVKAPTAQFQDAARTIEPQLRGKIGIFTLKTGSPDYNQVAAQMTVPGVLAMVKGGGMSAVSGDITEPKLVQALVAASRAGGCGPSAGSGCCP